MSYAVAAPIAIGRRVKAALAAAGLRQVDAASAIGITQPNLSRRIRGETSWRDGELETLAALCGIDPGEWDMDTGDSVNGTDPIDVPKPPSRPIPPPPRPKTRGSAVGG